MNKIKTFGQKSLLCLLLGLLCFPLWLGAFEINELLSGLIFYSGILLILISFILGIIGLIKDQNKLLSIITIILFILIILVALYYYYFILPKVIEELIHAMESSWGINPK